MALTLLLLLASGAAELAGIATAFASGARSQTIAAVLADQKIEQLRALAWRVDPSGSIRLDGSTNLAAEPPSGGGAGAGLGASPPTSLDANTPLFVDFLSPAGTWLGSGSSPPPGARYVRRWSVSPLPEDPSRTLIVRVLVTTVERDRQAARPRRRLSGDALVATLLSLTADGGRP